MKGNKFDKVAERLFIDDIDPATLTTLGKRFAVQISGRTLTIFEIAYTAYCYIDSNILNLIFIFDVISEGE